MEGPPARPLHLGVCVLALAMGAALMAFPKGSAGALEAGGPDAGWKIVRFTSLITDADRARVESVGLRVVDYEPANGYLVWGAGAAAAKARRLARVASVGDLPVSRKLNPSLPARVGVSVLSEVSVYGPAAAHARAFLSAFGPITRSFPARADGLVVSEILPLRVEDLSLVAGDPSVLYIARASLRAHPEDEATDQIVAGNIGSNNRPVTGYPAWLSEKGVDGTGVKVAIVDTGIDPAHPDFLGRIDQTIDYTGIPAGQLDDYGHGTHVTGIVGGAPPAKTFPADPDGFVYGLGVAPGVHFVNQNAVSDLNTAFPPAGGYQILSRDSWRAGARLWNSSWHTGEGSRVGYIQTTRTFDEMARDADFETPGREDFLMVFSAGNAGAAGPTVPHEAKNVIAVGATMSGRGLVWPQTTDIDQIAGYSSRGPAADGRIFPTVSAPGDTVISARSSIGQLSALCEAVPPPNGGLLYIPCSGTSMAAPHVTGASALIHQWWMKRTGKLPSPAFVKALLVNGATDMGTKDIPNSNEGWGRINLSNVFSSLASIYVDQKKVFARPGQSFSYRVKVIDPHRQLRATLAWSDAPAAVGANPALVNDLDLRIDLINRSGKVLQTWLGNVFKDGVSVTGGAPDRRNNVENVFFNPPKRGTYRITVKSHNLPGDGIPYNTDKTDQDFALVVRGAF